ncbi:hypothetical protein PENTCL1PPCAC_30671, partial [Pristionchus entomophagus]
FQIRISIEGSPIDRKNEVRQMSFHRPPMGGRIVPEGMEVGPPVTVEETQQDELSGGEEEHLPLDSTQEDESDGHNPESDIIPEAEITPKPPGELEEQRTQEDEDSDDEYSGIDDDIIPETEFTLKPPGPKIDPSTETTPETTTKIDPSTETTPETTTKIDPSTETTPETTTKIDPPMYPTTSIPPKPAPISTSKPVPPSPPIYPTTTSKATQAPPLHTTLPTPKATTTAKNNDVAEQNKNMLAILTYSLIGLLVFLLVAATIIILLLVLGRRRKREKEEEEEDRSEGDKPKIIKIVIPNERGGRLRKGKKGGKKSKTESSQCGKPFRIPSKDIKFKGPLKMQKRFHGEARHEFEDADTSNRRVKEIVFDPSLNEAVAIGEGVEEYENSGLDRASFSDTDRSEFLRDQDTPPKRTKKSREKPSKKG